MIQAIGDKAPPYVSFGGAPGGPGSQAMDERDSKTGKYTLVQVGEYSIATDKINGMWASCCCLGCCYFSTLKIEYRDPVTQASWIQKFRFCCDDAGAINAQTKINNYLGNNI